MDVTSPSGLEVPGSRGLPILTALAESQSPGSPKSPYSPLSDVETPHSAKESDTKESNSRKSILSRLYQRFVILFHFADKRDKYRMVIGAIFAATTGLGPALTTYVHFHNLLSHTV
jgi:hypothetical protein